MPLNQLNRLIIQPIRLPICLIMTRIRTFGIININNIPIITLKRRAIIRNTLAIKIKSTTTWAIRVIRLLQILVSHQVLRSPALCQLRPSRLNTWHLKINTWIWCRSCLSNIAAASQRKLILQNSTLAQELTTTSFKLQHSQQKYIYNDNNRAKY